MSVCLPCPLCGHFHYLRDPCHDGDCTCGHRPDPKPCDCMGVLPGSHANTVTLPTPEHLIDTSLGCYTFRETTCVDRCIADEVQRLWSLGIVTTGSCCGHNTLPGYIGVTDDCIPRMKALGYRVRPNEMDLAREDGFYPMSTGDTVNTNMKNPYPAQVTAVALIEAERQRQIEQEEWTLEHDDSHQHGEMAAAAAAYANWSVAYGSPGDPVPLPWPWEPHWWKPSPDPIRNLVKAGALIVAEIERLQRAGADHA